MSASPTQATPSQVVKALVNLPGWRLHGEGEQIAIEKDWRFASHAQALHLLHALRGWTPGSLFQKACGSEGGQVA